MKKIITTILVLIALWGIKVEAFTFPRDANSNIAPTTTVQFCWTDYSDDVKAKAHNLFIESGARFARLNSGDWIKIQSLTPCVVGPNCTYDGYYYYNWKAVAGFSTDDLVNTPGLKFFIEITGIGNLGVNSPNHSFKTPFANIFAYGMFLRELANHFKDRVVYYVLDNEPGYQFYTYNGVLNDSAAYFALLFKFTAKVLKSVDPNAKMVFNDGNFILGTNVDKNPYKGIDAMEKMGALQSIDVYDKHEYGDISTSTSNPTTEKWNWRGTLFTSDMSYVKTKFTQYGLTPEYWIGEAGFGTGDPLDATNTTYALRVEKQSQDMIKSNVIALSQGITTFCEVVMADRTWGLMPGDLNPTQPVAQYGVRPIAPYGEGSDGLTEGYLWKDPDGSIHATSTANKANIPYPYMYATGINDEFRSAGVVTGDLVGLNTQKKASFNPYKKMTTLLTDTSFTSSTISVPIELYRFDNTLKTVYAWWANQPQPNGDYHFNIALPQNYLSGYKYNGWTLATSTMNYGFASGTSYDVSGSTTVKWMCLNKVAGSCEK